MADAVIPSLDAWSSLKRWQRRDVGRSLRLQGLSYREISELIPVSKGTLSGWCRDIVLSFEQETRIREKRPDLTAVRELGARRRRDALERAAAIRAAAREEARALLDDPPFVAGVVAYWAEGAKRTTSLKFSNSDPGLVRLFLRWSSRFLDVESRRITIALHLHSGQHDGDRRAFWAKETGLQNSQFRKTYVKREGSGHRKNVLYAGTASLRVARSGDLVHRVSGWIDAVRESVPHLG